MDMLNEGVHVDRIDGIIWFRPLNENSKILFLQQLGRCISAIGEDNKDNIPTVIDLVNNTLKVDILKGVKKEKSDLSKLIKISRWIEINGFPNINSSIEEEVENARILKRIQLEYDSFLDNKKLKEIKVERKALIKKIIKIGREFDLWNYEFPKGSKEIKTGEYKPKDDLLSIFGVKGRLRRYSDLYKSVDEINNMSPEKYVDIIEEYCIAHKEWPKQGEKEKQVQGKTGEQLASWLSGTSGYNKKEFKYGEELKQRLDNLKLQYGNPAKTYVDLIEEYCIAHKEWPKFGEKEKQVQGKTGEQLAFWLSGTSGYNKNEFKYGEELKQRLDNLKSIYYKRKNNYDKIDQITNNNSHFQNVVNNIENSKENIDGRKLC